MSAQAITVHPSGIAIQLTPNAQVPGMNLVPIQKRVQLPKALTDHDITRLKDAAFSTYNSDPTMGKKIDLTQFCKKAVKAIYEDGALLRVPMTVGQKEKLARKIVGQIFRTFKDRGYNKDGARAYIHQFVEIAEQNPPKRKTAPEDQAKSCCTIL